MMHNKHDDVIGRALYIYGEFAESENTVMRHFVQTGDTVLDIGANVGTVSLALADAVGPSGLVLSFEPQVEIFRYLCANTVLNGCSQIICQNKAVGSGYGFVDFPPVDYEKHGNFGAVSLIETKQGPVEVIPVDSLGLEKCKLIKIDVEGMEWAVFEGAKKTILKYMPVVYYEDKKGPNSGKLISSLQKIGYKLYWHFANFYSANNYNGVAKNVFGEIGDMNVLCVPPGNTETVHLPIINDPDEDYVEVYSKWLTTR